MKLICAFLTLSCALWEAACYPVYYPYYASNLDSMTFGNYRGQGAMVYNRYYQPYYPQGLGGGMAAFMVQNPYQPLMNQGYNVQDTKGQTLPQTIPPQQPQQNEVFYPQTPEDRFTTRQPEITETTELATLKTTSVPEILEPEVEEVEKEKPRKRVSKKKPVKNPEIEDDDEEEYVPQMPTGAMFPMFFGWGAGRSQGGAPGVMAIANSYSTGRGGASSSHATAYGGPRPEDNLRREQHLFTAPLKH